MKHTLTLVLFLGVIIFFNSCTKRKNKPDELKLFPVSITSGGYKYIDRNGKVIINQEFKEASVFINGLALVKTLGENSKWGFINEEGKFIIQPKYKSASLFNNGLAWVVTENGAPSAININGDVKINIPNINQVELFSEGLAAFNVLEIDSTGELKAKWGYVDTEGNIAIPPQFNGVSHFINGKAAVANKENKWGYIDREGKILVDFQYDGLSNFVDGIAFVSSNKENGNKVGLIGEDGNYILNPQFSNLKYDIENYLFEKDNKWGWCDKDGKLIINPQFEMAFPFWGNDLAPVKCGKTWGYINKKGKMVINPQFERAFPFNGNRAIVESGGKIGIIDELGTFVLSLQFEKPVSPYGDLDWYFEDDLRFYFIYGGSKYYTVVTDYFDVSEIIGKIKNDITEDSIMGLSLNTPISDILPKFNKKEEDLDKNTAIHKIIDGKKISNDASLEFYIIGKPWTSSSGRYNIGYIFDKKMKPEKFSYIIRLKGRAEGKQDKVFDAIDFIFSGYKKDNRFSNKNEKCFVSKSQIITIYKGTDYIELFVQSFMDLN